MLIDVGFAGGFVGEAALAGEDVANASGNGAGAGIVEEELFGEGAEDFGDAADGGAQNGGACSKGFDHDQAKAFEGGGGDDGEGGGAVGEDKVFVRDIAQQANVVVQAKAFDLGLEGFGQGTPACDEQEGIGLGGLNGGHGGDQVFEAHAFGEAAGSEEDGAILGPAELGAGLSGGEGAVEAIDVDAAGDDVDAVLGDAVGFVEDFVEGLGEDDELGAALVSLVFESLFEPGGEGLAAFDLAF